MTIKFRSICFEIQSYRTNTLVINIQIFAGNKNSFFIISQNNSKNKSKIDIDSEMQNLAPVCLGV